MKRRSPGTAEWVVSDWGKAGWPGINPDDIPHNIPLKQQIDVMAPKRPETVAFVANEPDVEEGQQIVVWGDDSAGTIILEAYEDPSSEPVIVIEVEFPAI
jgi:hypothetical protein